MTLAPYRRYIVAVCCLSTLSALAARPAFAQQSRDSARAVDTTGAKPELKPPISPRRAFAYSLMAPGYAQSILGRARAGTLQLTFEAVALIMIRQSAADVREARRMVADSIPVSFVDATTGTLKTRFERTAFPTSLIRSRRSHLEDWIAVLIANHLFSAADGYVAALLWDLPTEIALRAAPRSAELAMRVYW